MDQVADQPDLLLGRGLFRIQGETVFACILYDTAVSLAGQLIVPVIPGFHDNGIGPLVVKLRPITGAYKDSCHHQYHSQYPCTMPALHLRHRLQ